MPHQLWQQKRSGGGVEPVNAADPAIIAVDGECAPKRDQELVLLSKRVVRALVAGRDIEDPVGALDLERDVTGELGHAQGPTRLVDPA